MGLCHLHCGGPGPMLHRDLKPANLLVFSTREPSRPYRVKLGDLGYATCLTRSKLFRSRMGNGYTMAPEVLDGKYYTASDMFAWGVTMCCAIVLAIGGPHVDDPLANGRLWVKEKAIELLRKHRVALADLLETCCDNEATKRPTASEALSVVMASRYGDSAVSAAVQPSPSHTAKVAPVYDVLAIVEVMEAQRLDRAVIDKVIDTVGGLAVATLYAALQSSGLPFETCLNIKYALDVAVKATTLSESGAASASAGDEQARERGD